MDIFGFCYGDGDGYGDSDGDGDGYGGGFGNGYGSGYDIQFIAPIAAIDSCEGDER